VIISLILIYYLNPENQDNMNKITLISFFLAITSTLKSQNFNDANVQNLHDQLYASLDNDPLCIQWENAQTDQIKSQKFDEIIVQIGNPPLGRQWSYPGHPDWPLINWDKIDKLSKVMDDQFDILNQVGVIALNDQEAAKISVVEWLVMNGGRDMEQWYEKWLLNLVKSSNTNLKRLVFWSIKNFAEDIGRQGNTDNVRAIDWIEWQNTFNQSDNLGKAILLVCMNELALRKEEFTKVAEIHLQIFNNSNDDLKVIALYASTRKLGVGVVAKWQEIADNNTNLKLKALAQEAINRNF
jgi:hypothetical protein